MPRLTISELAERIGGTLEGDGSISIDGLATVDNAHEGQLTFVGDEKHAKLWPNSKAAAVLVKENLELTRRSDTDTIIRVPDADQAIGAILELFEEPAELPDKGIHPSAVIDESASLGEGVRIGPYCVVGRNCILGKGAILLGGVHLHSDVRIGDSSVLHAGVVVHQRCTIGSHSTLYANAVIGSDGFGFRPSADGMKIIKFPHIGTVAIGDDVEIGSCTCIDRGKFGATRIGDGTKIDNLCQIGHSCEIGKCCILCGQVGIAGSVVIGDGTKIGGGAGIADHLVIGRGVSIGAQAGVMNNVPDGETWVGAPAGERSRILREATAIRRLPEWSKPLRRLVKREKQAGTTNE